MHPGVSSRALSGGEEGEGWVGGECVHVNQPMCHLGESNVHRLVACSLRKLMIVLIVFLLQSNRFPDKKKKMFDQSGVRTSFNHCDRN